MTHGTQGSRIHEGAATSADDPDVSDASDASDAPRVQAEQRWPMAVAVLAMVVLVVLPPYAMPEMAFGVAAVMLVLLGTIMVADPGRIDDRSRLVRRLNLLLVGFLMAAALIATVILIADIIIGAKVTEDALVLLAAGVKVWLGNNLAFAFVYWQMDRGGPAERAAALRPYPDLQFPQDGDDNAPPGWRPMFWDYLYVAFTTANAFSPTDTMPLTHRAKLAMGTQALIAFAVVGLVLARAIGLFS